MVGLIAENNEVDTRNGVAETVIEEVLITGIEAEATEMIKITMNSEINMTMNPKKLNKGLRRMRIQKVLILKKICCMTTRIKQMTKMN